jgi:CRISPR-associated protein (TIGR02584 family)
MKRILLCVTGMSPQIVTETVYALTTRPEDAWVPDEVHLITTAKGARNAELRLLSDDPGWFHRLRRDYALPDIAFDAGRIHVIEGRDGAKLEDIRNDADNHAAADAIAALVRELTADAETELHASIAGGRKTMGYLLGAALGLYARPQDRLSHVLVTPQFESHPEFFYPTPYARVINALDRGADALDCRDAQVWLGDIPFVRLRELLPADLNQRALSYAELVALANRNTDGEDWWLDVEAGRLEVGAQGLDLSAREVGLLLLLAASAAAGAGLRAPLKGAADDEWHDLACTRIDRAFGRLAAPDAFRDWIARARDGGEFAASFEQALSRLDRKLCHGLGLRQSPIERHAPGARGRARAYALALPAHRFHLRRR